MDLPVACPTVEPGNRRQLEARAVRRMTRLAHYHALREGVPSAEVDDCGMTFVERMLLSGGNSAEQPLEGRGDAWLHRCAQNHARNYRRSAARHHPKLISLGDVRKAASRNFEPVSEPSAESQVIRNIARRSIDDLVDKLLPEVRAIFVSHYFHGYTAAEIAARSGRTAHAVEMALYRARRRLRRELHQEGFSLSDWYVV
jgi:RNA polymerase sigma factor (sigma-70 family)